MSYVRDLREKIGHIPLVVIGAFGLIHNSKGELLLQKTSDKSSGDAWVLPGGILEPGETAEATLRREILEETGHDVSVDYFQGVYTNTPLEHFKNGDIIHGIPLIYVCTSKGIIEEPTSMETAELRFFPVEIAQGEVADNKLQILTDYIQGIRGIAR